MGQTYITKKLNEPQLKFVNCPSRIRLGFNFLNLKTEMNKERAGIWITVELIKDEQLDWANKALMSEIVSLHKLPSGCFASNEKFGELLGIEKSAASRRISKLKKLGYIQTRDVYDRNSCIGRFITPIKHVPKKELPEQENKKQEDFGKQQEEKANNDSDEGRIESPKHQHDSPEGSSDKNHTPLTEEQGGSSHTTIGVVTERLGGSSPGNTINTSISSDIKVHLLNQHTGDEKIIGLGKDPIITNDPPINSIEDKSVEACFENSNSTDLDAMSEKRNITTKEFREIMNDFFYDYPTWEPDLMRLELDEFVRRTQYYHSNIPKYIGMIREFYEL